MLTNADLSAALDEQKEAVIETVLGFDIPKGRWLIQRPDGQFFAGYGSQLSVYLFTPRAEQAAACQTERGAQALIDIGYGSQAGRAAFRDCKPMAHEVPLSE